VVLEYDQYPSTEDGLVAQSVYGGYALRPDRAVDQEGDTRIQPPARRGTIPAHIEVSRKSRYVWRIFVDKPMTLKVDVSYSFQGEEGLSSISVSSQPGIVQGIIRPTRKVVGEPNSDWQIASFESHRLGQLQFTEAGSYEISMEIDPRKDEEIGFQWLWLGTD
jgi:alpha-L-fucosidase